MNDTLMIRLPARLRRKIARIQRQGKIVSAEIRALLRDLREDEKRLRKRRKRTTPR